MPKQQTSIFIDDSAIYVMSAKGRQPQKWASTGLEKGLVQDGVIKDQEAVALKVKELLQTLKLRGKQVACAVSGVNCLYHLLILPELPDELVTEAINREASQSLGISIDEVYLSWQVLAVDRGQMRIYLTAMPRDMVDSMVVTLQQAGLKPYLMDMKPLCLARASSEARAIIVDTRPTGFDVVILANGIPEVIRCLPLPEEASESEQTALLKAEMDRAVVFYNSAHMDAPIDLSVPILVSGSIATREDDWDVLRGPRERPLQLMIPTVEERDGFMATEYMTNIGMALKEVLLEEEGVVANSIVNFNALPEKYLPRKLKWSEMAWLPTILVGVAVVAALIWSGLAIKRDNDTLAADLEALETRTRQQQLTDANVKALEGQVTAAVNKVGDLDGLLTGLDASRLNTVTDLATIHNLLGQEMHLMSISVGTDAIILSGVASSETHVFEYGVALRETGRFASVLIQTISVGDEVSFVMTLKG